MNIYNWPLLCSRRLESSLHFENYLHGIKHGNWGPRVYERPPCRGTLHHIVPVITSRPHVITTSPRGRHGSLRGPVRRWGRAAGRLPVGPEEAGRGLRAGADARGGFVRQGPTGHPPDQQGEGELNNYRLFFLFLFFPFPLFLRLQVDLTEDQCSFRNALPHATAFTACIYFRLKERPYLKHQTTLYSEYTEMPLRRNEKSGKVERIIPNFHFKS